MSQRTNASSFRRRVVLTATRKRLPEGLGMRRAAASETPLSPDEIFFGAQHGLIRLPPFNSRIA